MQSKQIAVVSQAPELEMPKLSKWQQEVWTSGKRNWLLAAGRRCGKTTLAILRSIAVSMSGKRVAWCAVDTEQGRAGWDELVDYVKANLLEYCTRRDFITHGVIEFVGGGSIRLVSAWESNPNSKRGRGRSLHLIVLDEVQLMSERFYRRIRPSLLTTRGAVVMTLTPPETPDEAARAKWLRDWIDEVGAGTRDQGDWLIEERATKAEDYAFFIQVEAATEGEELSWKEAVAAADTFLKEERQADPVGYEREYNVRWIVDKGGLVYPEWNEPQFVRNEYDYDPRYPFFVVMDWGEGNSWTVALFCQGLWMKSLAGHDFLAVRFFDEIKTRRVISEEAFINACLVEPKQNYPLPTRWGYDTRAPRLGDALFNLSLPHEPCNVAIEGGIARLRRLMMIDDCGEPLLQINPRCSRLIHNLSRYKRSLTNGKPDDRYMDGADAARYGVSLIEAYHGLRMKEAETIKEQIARIAATTHGHTMAVGGVMEIDFGI